MAVLSTDCAEGAPMACGHGAGGSWSSCVGYSCVVGQSSRLAGAGISFWNGMYSSSSASGICMMSDAFCPGGGRCGFGCGCCGGRDVCWLTSAKCSSVIKEQCGGALHLVVEVVLLREGDVMSGLKFSSSGVQMPSCLGELGSEL
eukprot:6329073-Amphidinium_carterae.1